MSSFRVFNRSVGRIISTVALVAAAVVPSFLPAMASADQVTGRSIALSSSSKGATNVTYDVKFTPVANAGAFAIDFCTQSPIYGDSCTGPSGLDTTGAASTQSGFTDVTHPATNRVVVAGTITGGVGVDVPITGINNPTNSGQYYARITTFTAKSDATGDTAEAGVNSVDKGGVALSATDTIGVSGAVLEQMVFCVSKAAISAGCTGTSLPTLQLGTLVGDVHVLSSDNNSPSTGDIYTQISTNAVGGAVVSLKNDVACGGMKRLGAAVCDIVPIASGGGANGFTQGQAGFGVIANADTSSDTTQGATGTFQIKSGSIYSNTAYRMNYTGVNTGVTSTYGDPILDTNGTQPNNRNMKLTFGAIAAQNTPAGNYSANLSLVATGTF